MTSKLNIFNSLPQHASDSEDEVTIKNAKNKTRHEKQEQRRNDTEKSHGHTAPRDPNQKEDVSRQKNQQRQKGVTAEPHPNDRQSGTGNQAYGNKAKKSGAGKGNWGNYKEDKKAAEEGEEGETTETQEEEKPEGITLSEYFANKKVATSQPLVNEAKSKITSEQLMKEVGKATLLKTRNQQDIDDKKVGKKKDTLNVDHHAGINSEHANLLNFRTGFIEKEYKERVRGEEGTQQPRRFGGQRERREKEETTQAEGEKTAEGETATPVEGETATPVEGKAKEQGQEGQKRREGGYNKGARGGQRGDRPHGDRPHGDRPYGDRKPYGAKATKVNFEDESAFPKLG